MKKSMSFDADALCAWFSKARLESLLRALWARHQAYARDYGIALEYTHFASLRAPLLARMGLMWKRICLVEMRLAEMDGAY